MTELKSLMYSKSTGVL